MTIKKHDLFERFDKEFHSDHKLLNKKLKGTGLKYPKVRYKNGNR